MVSHNQGRSRVFRRESWGLVGWFSRTKSTGALLWSYATGNYVLSSPAVANSVVYIGSTDSNVYALNAGTGAKVWSYHADGRWSSPAVANGVVFVGGENSHMYALNAHTGAKLGAYPAHGMVDSSPAVVNGVVYFGCSGQCGVYAYGLK